MDENPNIDSGKEKLVTLRVFLSAMEAQWARSILASAGICSFIPDGQISTTYNVVGGVRLMVPEAQFEDADAFLTVEEEERLSGADEPDSEDYDDSCDELPEEIDEQGAIDPGDLCPYKASTSVPIPIACPKCGSEKLEDTERPEYEVEGLFSSIGDRLLNRTWHKCTACGEVFKG